MAEESNISGLTDGFMRLGLKKGDTVLVRAGLRAVGQMENAAEAVIQSMLDVVGRQGTIISLSFSGSTFIKHADPARRFKSDTPTYAGALPQYMLEHPLSKRSKHPTCSFVAIGKNAEWITENHGPDSPAYEPVRKIIDLNGKMILIGCAAESPGFTTTHLAEYDLGLLNRVVFPWLNSVYYEQDDGAIKLFRRKDIGLCSMSFYKFYSHYVKAGILRSGFIGNAYAVLVPAKEAYDIEKQVLSKNARFTICEDPFCFMCNVRRWDRCYMIPAYLARKMIRKIKRSLADA